MDRSTLVICCRFRQHNSWLALEEFHIAALLSPKDEQYHKHKLCDQDHKAICIYLWALDEFGFFWHPWIHYLLVHTI